MKKLPHKIITLEGFKVIGISKKINPKDGNDMKDIGALWEKFYKENIIEKIPNKENKEILGIYYDYEGNHLDPYTFMIGAKVSLLDKIPKGMELINIPPLNYIIFTAEGEFPKCLIDTWKEIWNAEISRTFSYDFEVYNEAFQLSKTKDKKLNIFISTNSEVE